MPRLMGLLVSLVLVGGVSAQSVVFTVDSHWGSGFQATVTLSNGGTTPISGWTLDFDWPYGINSVWDGSLVATGGGRHTVSDVGWNSVIPALGSVSFGMTANGPAPVADPSAACLNGVPVSVNGVASVGPCTGGGGGGPPTAMPAAPVVAPNRSGRRIVAYYTAWSVYARNFHVADIPADRLTHVNYAFANISAAGLIELGDPYADVDRFYPGDSWAPGALRGSFNQLRILKEAHPHLKTLISVGGWTWSSRFSDVALTPASRAAFAQSCVDFIVQYGFDGVDVDWEYPVSGGLTSNVTRPSDKQNYTLLLAELRARLDAREVMDGREYLLTIAAPAGPAVLVNLELGLIPQHVDWINLMAYDFHGSWSATTNFNAALFPSPGDPSGGVIATDFNGAAAVQTYLAAGVPPSQLHMGTPYFGRGWQGVANVNDGLFVSHGGIPPGTFEPGVFDYADIVANYVTPTTRHFHPAAQVPWFYDPATGIMISYDDPQSLGAKADYAVQHGLGGVMAWDLSSDDAQHALTNALFSHLMESAPWLSASTTGGATGDLSLYVYGTPAPASHVLLVASATPAPAGLGTGPVLGLFPDALLVAALSVPAAPGSPLHYPLTGDPYAAGPVTWPLGTFTGLAGTQWELFAASYDVTTGSYGASGIAVLLW